ncbi:phage tail protein I [Pseudoalteromonas xiamenensis]|uniref:phage tail protein I n=1 Tax=Pseudoalteromonas xiamenensis TaxID=882626 RepID=UPI0027E43804|nr:phage tail protein I [Pseudoalteromonas xiamenensis]WMN59269.1 phage tail protein I [Pseudoalteromonas xiamenensis]
MKVKILDSPGIGLQLNRVVQSGFQDEVDSTIQALNTLAFLWRPALCPREFLPWLAWSQGIKEWDEKWPEQTQRQLIDASYEQHKYLGTRYAVVNALAPFNMDAKITEWFETQPKLTPGTFNVDVYVTDRGIDLPLIKDVRTIVDRAKRKSVHYNLTVNLQCRTLIPLSAISCSSNIITIFPLSH